MHRHVFKNLGFLVLSLLLVVLVTNCGPTPSPGSPPSPTAATQEAGKTVVSAAPATAVPATPKPSEPSDTLVYNLDVAVTGGLDARQTVDSDGKTVSFMISETLVKFDWKKNDVVPNLAESWQIAADGRSVTLKLRPNVKFTDGTPFNADAVVFNLEQVYNKDAPFHDAGKFLSTDYLSGYQKAEKVDDLTVRISFNPADPIMMWRLTLEPGFIQSPEAVKKWGKDYTNHAVGTGPYKIVEFAPDTKVVLERFEDYWGPKPAIKNLIFKVNGDAQSKVADLLAGNVDIISRPPADQMDQLAATPGIKIWKFPTTWVSHLNFNLTKEILKDKRVRQAMEYGFDKETLNNVLNKGLSTPNYYPWHEGAYAFEPNVTIYKFDPAKAKALLDEAGWKLAAGQTIRQKDGKPLEIKFLQAANLVGLEAPIPVLFQANMKDIGIQVDQVKLDLATFYDPKVGVFNPETYDVVLIGWIEAVPDPSMFYDSNYACASRAPANYNTSQYCNPVVDDLLNKAKGELDLAKRAEYYKQVQRILADDPPTLWHSAFSFVLASNDRVQNLYGTPRWQVDFEKITFAK